MMRNLENNGIGLEIPLAEHCVHNAPHLGRDSRQAPNNIAQRHTGWQAGGAYCHRDSSDSCRRDFNLVSLICRLWNALSTSGGSVHVYRFSTIFAIDRVWFGSMPMYSSWKRQLLSCESCFAEALELPLESFLCPDQAVPTLHNPNVNMCPFAESSF